MFGVTHCPIAASMIPDFDIIVKSKLRLLLKKASKCVVIGLSESEFTQMLIEAGYSERLAQIIEQWYNSH